MDEYSASKQLEEDKKEAIEAAVDLCYGRDVIERIKNAKTSSEVTRAMNTARKESMKLDELRAQELRGRNTDEAGANVRPLWVYNERRADSNTDNGKKP